MVKYFLYHENHQGKLERPQEDFFIKPLQDKNFVSKIRAYIFCHSGLDPESINKIDLSRVATRNSRFRGNDISRELQSYIKNYCRKNKIVGEKSCYFIF